MRPCLDAALPARILADRFLVVARLPPRAGATSAVRPIARAYIFLAGDHPFAGTHHLHVAIEGEAVENPVLVLAPGGTLLAPDAVHLLGVLVGTRQGRPVEVLVVDRRQPVDVHPRGVGIARTDVDRGRERHERELDRLVDLLQHVGLQRQRADQFLCRGLQEVDALRAGAGAEVVHRSGIVEDEGDLERVLQADLRVGAERQVARSGIVDQFLERREEVRFVVKLRGELQSPAAGLVARQRHRQFRVVRIDVVQVGEEEVVRIGDERFVAGPGDDLPGRGDTGGVERVQRRRLLSVHLGKVDRNRQPAHDRHERNRRHQRVVAAPVTDEFPHVRSRPPPEGTECGKVPQSHVPSVAGFSRSRMAGFTGR